MLRTELKRRAKELVCDERGRLSWTRVSYIAATIVLMRAFYVDAELHGLAWDKMLTFGILFGLVRQSSKLLDLLQRVKDPIGGGINGEG